MALDPPEPRQARGDARRVWGRVAAVVVASGFLGCALIVGSPDADRRAVSDHDAGVPTHDAASEVDAGHVHGDASHDAQTRRDGSTRDAREGSEAGPAVDAKSRADAGDAGGFCKNFVPPPGALFLCDDFDEDPDATVLGLENSYGGGTSLVVQSTVSRSPPNAMLVKTSPDAGTYSESAIYFYRTDAVGSSYTIECDFLVGALLPGDNNNEIVDITFGPVARQAEAAVSLLPGDAGTVDRIAVYETDPVDGGPRYVLHAAVPVSIDGWAHLSFTVKQTATGPVDSVAINGTLVETNFPLGEGFLVGPPDLSVGWVYTQYPGFRQAYIDNVVYITDP